MGSAVFPYSVWKGAERKVCTCSGQTAFLDPYRVPISSKMTSKKYVPSVVAFAGVDPTETEGYLYMLSRS